jgi:hypothetical protein
MLLRLLGLCLLLSVWLPLTPVHAAGEEGDLDEFRTTLGNEWQLTRNDKRRNIKTWARLEDGKRYRSFRVEAELDGQPESLAHVLLDFENYTKWFWQTRESRLVKKVSPTEFIVYMVHNAPAGLPDRDTVLRGVLEPQTRNKPYIVLKVTAVPDYLPMQRTLVRMPAEEITVKFSPVGPNKVLVEAEGFFDAGGTVPAWAANFVQRSAPYSVILGMQRMMAQDRYVLAKTPLPFAIYDWSNYN